MVTAASSSPRLELLTRRRGPLVTDLALLSPGAWVIHPILILLGKFLIDAIPGIGADLSWSLVNCGYMAVRPLAPLFLSASALPILTDASVSDPHTDLIPHLPPHGRTAVRGRVRPSPSLSFLLVSARADSPFPYLPVSSEQVSDGWRLRRPDALGAD